MVLRGQDQGWCVRQAVLGGVVQRGISSWLAVMLQETVGTLQAMAGGVREERCPTGSMPCVCRDRDLRVQGHCPVGSMTCTRQAGWGLGGCKGSCYCRSSSSSSS